MSYKKHHQFNLSVVRKTFERDGGRCIYCGDYAGEIDHVIPSCDGGPDIQSNAVCCCKKCNRKKIHHLDVFLTRAIFWLLQKGEDTKWMDDFDFKR